MSEQRLYDVLESGLQKLSIAFDHGLFDPDTYFGVVDDISNQLDNMRRNNVCISGKSFRLCSTASERQRQECRNSKNEMFICGERNRKTA